MLVPSIFGENLFDDWFDVDFPQWPEFRDLYLTVGASKEHDQTNSGKAIRKERYSGSMSRSFYIGEGIKEEDVHAKFEHGVLHLELPKEKAPEVPEKKLIQIEG